MRRCPLLLAAAMLVLAVATACGAPGALAPSPSPTVGASSMPAPSEVTPTPTPTRTSTPTPTPTPSQEPAIGAPPAIPLPRVPSAPEIEIPVEGPAAVADASYDYAVPCRPPVRVWLAADIPAVGDESLPSFGCNEGSALELRFGVSGRLDRAFAIVEADLSPPLVLRAAAGEGFSAASVRRLLQATPDQLLAVSGTCTGPQEFRIGDASASCKTGDVYFWFQEQLTAEQVLTDRDLPPGFDGSLILTVPYEEQ